ncbi:MAG: DUF1573 domain-containing protein [Bacteroidota bacterium]
MYSIRFSTFLLVFLGLVIISGCNSNTENNQDNPDADTTLVSDTSETTVEEVDSTKIGKGEQELPVKDTTKNIPDSEKAPEQEKIKKKGPKISFAETDYSWGEIEQGEKVTKTFTFTNIGDRPLNILSASATCGCTMPSYPFLPIEPGGTGKIEVTYDSRLKAGPQQAKVTVQTDARPKTHYLMLRGMVKTPSQETKEVEETPADTTSNEGQ